MKKILFGALAIAMTLTLGMAMASCDKGSSTTQYTVTFDPDGGTMPGKALGVKEDVKVDKDQAIGDKMPGNPAKGGDAFLGWFTEKNGGGTEYTRTAPVVSGNTTLFAKWDAVQEGKFRVILNPSGGTITPAFIEKDDGQTVTFAELPTTGTKTGAIFKGWTATAAGTVLLTSAWTATASTTIYAVWEDSDEPPPPPPPPAYWEEGSGPWVEEVSLANGNFAAYYFELPTGKSWSDYDGLSVKYMLDDDTIATGQNRSLRLQGNYIMGDFRTLIGSGDAEGLDYAVAGYAASGPSATNKFAPYILDNKPNGNELAGSLVQALGEFVEDDIEADKWFTFEYLTDGSNKHPSAYEAQNMPSGSGPFIFAFGLPGYGAQTSLVTDVKLLSSSGDLPGKPLYIRVESESKNYPAFAAWPTANGSDGYKETSRKFLKGAAEPVAMPFVTITFDLNNEDAAWDDYDEDGEPTALTRQVARGGSLGSLPAAPHYDGAGAFRFGGWFDNEALTGTAVTGSTTFSAATTLYAKWIERITITFDLGDEAANATFKDDFSGTIVIDKGEAIGTLPNAETSTADIALVGWFDADDEEISADTKFDADAKVTAQWALSITITFDLNTTDTSAEFVTAADATRNIVAGNAVGALPAVTRDDYKVVFWSTSATDDGSTDTNKVTAATTFSAAQTVYAIWKELDPGIKIGLGGDTVANGFSSVDTLEWVANVTTKNGSVLFYFTFEDAGIDETDFEDFEDGDKLLVHYNLEFVEPANYAGNDGVTTGRAHFIAKPGADSWSGTSNSYPQFSEGDNTWEIAEAAFIEAAVAADSPGISLQNNDGDDKGTATAPNVWNLKITSVEIVKGN